jgi:hypothetical protein
MPYRPPTQLTAFRKRTTANGWPVLCSKDSYGKDVRLQLSSLADKECVWVGAGASGDTDALLDRRQARAIGEALLAFADEGRALFERLIPPPSTTETR